MEITGISGKNVGFSAEIAGNVQNSSVSSMGKEKIISLKNTIQEIKEMIEGRKKLKDEVVSEAESLKSEIDKYLKENEKVQIGGADITREKNDLRHKRIEISELQLNEKITCWKDVALLKKELRENEKELTEKQERINTLNKIMEEE